MHESRYCPPYRPPTQKHPSPHRSVTALALGKARAFAAPCHPAPRQRLRHWLYLPPLPPSLLPRPCFTTAPTFHSQMNDARLRGKSPAIQHNSALPKAGQSLRRASLDGLPLRALRVRVMVCYVLRPSPLTPPSSAAAPSLHGARGLLRFAPLALRCQGRQLQSAVPPAPTFARRLAGLYLPHP